MMNKPHVSSNFWRGLRIAALLSFVFFWLPLTVYVAAELVYKGTASYD